MSQQQEGAEHAIAKMLREEIFRIPLLPQDQVVVRFREIDALLYPLAIRLSEDIPSVREYFCDIVHKVASGNTLGKNYFHKQDNEDEKNAKKELLKKSELRALSSSFALLRHTKAPKRFARVLKSAGFMRGVMEEAVEIFFEQVKDYESTKELMEKAAREHSLDYLGYETTIHKIREDLGLSPHDHETLEKIIPELEDQWIAYLDLRRQLIDPYFRLVYTTAMAFAKKKPAQTLDNFQNGLLGLLRAYKCYTPTRFAAFALVAKQWIKQSILLHIKSELNFIKLPIANWHAHQKLEKIKNSLEQKFNREATPEEIAVAAKIPLDKVKKIYDNVRVARVLSLNVPTHNEEEQNERGAWSLESISDTRTAHETLEEQAEYQTVRDVITHFDPEELLIFALVSGCLDLIDNSHFNPEDVEKERIRQLGARNKIKVIFKE